MLPKKTNREIDALKTWFLAQCRDLPWRNHPSPYAVWVSEVMLQQTQVAVVIPYFERWMQIFPTIQDLAKADLDAVIKEWEGLGYYSRARNLHQGARYVVENHDGILPHLENQLQKIKGLGPYTIGAILSFAFHQRKAAVDGNVIRVLARYNCITEDITKSPTIKHIHALAQEMLPEIEPWIISEALIELGATVCKRKPKCFECPLRNNCKAFAAGNADKLPFKSSKTAVTQLYRAVAVVSCGDAILIKRGSKGKIMSDLHEFPYFELNSALVDPKALAQQLFKEMQLKADWQESLQEVKHSFTRYRAQLYPHSFTVKEKQPIDGYEWVPKKRIKERAFSSGHKRILGQLSDL
ncbi:MAG: A/G-specific adenine glycosylase [Parachlamydiaceae bacterium]|nr:A/G-specific adenine glycosylase [Parachlamydiaceae bacterium]